MIEFISGSCNLRRLLLSFFLMMMQALSFTFSLLSSGAGMTLMVLLVSSVSGLEPECLRLLLLIVLEESLSFSQRKKLLSLLVQNLFFVFSLSV